MYASEVEGQKLTFFVSGKLWGRSLVMGDKETQGDWSHILGQCMAGKLKGKKLSILPAKVTTWSSWLEEHPESTATMLRPTAKQFTREYMKDAGKRTLADFGMGLVHSAEARFWRFDLLEKRKAPINDRLGKLNVVTYLDQEHLTGAVWNRQIQPTGEQPTVLEFSARDASVVDKQTQSTWDLRRGLAVAGPLKGTRLKAEKAIVSFTEAWKRFHPESTAWTP